MSKSTYNIILEDEPVLGSDKLYHILYKITKSIDDSIYVGIHSTYNYNDAYFGSGKIIIRKIKKYGKSYFTKHILKFAQTREELLRLEQQYVNLDFIRLENVLNLNLGGAATPGFKHTNVSYISLKTKTIYHSITHLLHANNIPYSKRATVTSYIAHQKPYNGFYLTELENFKQSGLTAKEFMSFMDKNINHEQRDGIFDNEDIKPDYLKNLPILRNDMTYVILNTGEVFNSLEDLAKHLNETANYIRLSIRKHFKCRSENCWLYPLTKTLQNRKQQIALLERFEYELNYRVRNKKAAKLHSKPVICVETGDYYPSCRSASLASNLSKSGVSEAIRTQGVAGGYHWRYATQDEILKFDDLFKQ